MARAAILFFALALLVLLSRWLTELVSPEPVVRKPIRHTPDFYLTQVQGWAMDEQGELQHRMHAVRLTHFGDDDSVELIQPRFVSFDSDRPRWTVSAATGTSDAEGKTVRLQGEVTMERRGAEPGLLTTRDLLLKPRQDYVETAAAVRFVEAGSVIDAVGLRGHLGAEGRLELLSKVRGIHEPNQR